MSLPATGLVGFVGAAFTEGALEGGALEEVVEGGLSVPFSEDESFRGVGGAPPPFMDDPLGRPAASPPVTLLALGGPSLLENMRVKRPLTDDFSEGALEAVSPGGEDVPSGRGPSGGVNAGDRFAPS